MNWIKENWTAIVIGIIVLAGINYFVSSNKPDELSDTFAQKQKCQELGSQYEDELRANENSLNYIYLIFIRIVYTYSEKHNTCALLYSYSYYIDHKLTGEGGVIIDLLENKELARYLDAVDEYGKFNIDPQRKNYTKTEVDYFYE